MINGNGNGNGNGNTGDVFRFGITVNAGDYNLGENGDVVIGCQKSCWETVVVVVGNIGDIVVLHTGDGYIQKMISTTNNTNNTNDHIYNKPLPLSCLSPPCKFSINASLPYGGTM